MFRFMSFFSIYFLQSCCLLLLAERWRLIASFRILWDSQSIFLNRLYRYVSFQMKNKIRPTKISLFPSTSCVCRSSSNDFFSKKIYKDFSLYHHFILYNLHSLLELRKCKMILTYNTFNGYEATRVSFIDENLAFKSSLKES